LKKDKSKLQPSNDLRWSAEKRLSREKAEDIQSMTEQDIRALVHELQVHQIELEMQNEELRRAQAELEASRAKHSDLYDFAPVGYFTFDKQGLILDANLTAARELGIERRLLINKPFRAFITEDREIFDSHLRKVFETGNRQTCEIRLKRKSGSEFYAQLESKGAKDSFSNNICRTSLIDITERKRSEKELRIYREHLEELVKVRTAELEKINEQLELEIAERKQMEESLRASENKYRNLVDNALVGVYQTNIKGNFLYANEALTSLLEFDSPEEMMSGAIFERCKNPNDGEALIENLKKTGKISNFELELLTKTGKIENVLLSATLEGDVISGMIRDITKRKIAEVQVLQQLQRITALRNIDMAITSSLDVRVTLNILLEQVTTQLRIDAATVLLLNPNTLTLGYVAGRGFRSRALMHTHLRLGEGYAGRAALERRMVSIPNLTEAENSFSKSPLLSDEEFISYYAVPLIAKGHVKGILETFHRSPINPDQEWLDFLEALAAQAALAVDNSSLFDKLQRLNIELILAYDTTLEGWAKALDMRDKETEGHSQRVTDMTVKIACAMGVSESELVHVRRGALLHDIGKMGIPDNILLKPGKLTEEEWEIMRKHPVYADEMLLPIAFLRPALDIPYYHHEKWDGMGYPRRLKGEQIPLSARIFAVVDVWDALKSDRPYRPAWSVEKALEYIRNEAGKSFDPEVVEIFLNVKAY
jgi:PAS domain S-box-containing protein